MNLNNNTPAPWDNGIINLQDRINDYQNRIDHLKKPCVAFSNDKEQCILRNKILPEQDRCQFIESNKLSQCANFDDTFKYVKSVCPDVKELSDMRKFADKCPVKFDIYGANSTLPIKFGNITGNENITGGHGTTPTMEMTFSDITGNGNIKL